MLFDLLQFCLAFKASSLPSLNIFVGERYHLKLCRFVNCSAPELHFSTRFFGSWPQKIAAISTPRGEGGIGIVRISGKEALSILCEIFKPKSRRNVSDLKSYTITYGHIYDGEKLVDEVLVSVMKGPKTYTREDIVEINCHGGYIITEKVLELVLKKGATLAESGEFTRRAFLNGRLDLTQEESVMDIIHGKIGRASCRERVSSPV